MDMTDEADLPFRSEYAKSSRAACKGCKLNIQINTLRLAIMVQSAFFDGKQPNWHHFECFWKRARVSSEADISGFDNLRWDDQEKIRKQIAASSDGSMKKSASGKGKKCYTDFKTEYAKSGASTCRKCEEKIGKSEVRIGVKDYESETALRYGPTDRWFHVICFADARDDLGFTTDKETDRLDGFKNLKKEDKELVKDTLGVGGEKKAKKRKAEAGADAGPSVVASDKKAKHDLANQLKAQSDELWEMRDQLLNQVDKKARSLLLEYNKQEVPSGGDKVLDRLSDCLIFGALRPCSECSDGQFVYSTSANGYRCLGNISEFTKCVNICQFPKRKPFKIPKQFHDVPFLKNYKSIVRNRIYPAKATLDSALPSSSKSSGGASSSSTLPLTGMTFNLIGSVEKSKAEITHLVEQLGGKFVTKVDEKLTAVISSQEEVTKMNKKMQKVRDLDLHVISLDFFETAKSGQAIQLLDAYKISSWGADVSKRVSAPAAPLVSEPTKSKSAKYFASKTSSAAYFTKSVPKSRTLKVKGGAAVDPDSELEDIAHVFEEEGEIYNAVLGMVDVIKGKNSYYKLQVLQADNNTKRFWLFRSWGRVGTTIGDNKVEPFYSKDNVLENFRALYLEKTGNDWSNKRHFRKVTGRFYPLEIDYGQDDEQVTKLQLQSGPTSSTLDIAIQKLIQRIFDIETMKKALVEYEIDLQKMPLGKLSRNQIQKAYSVLKDLQKSIDENASANSFLDGTNRFYTLIPHDFGMERPTMLDNADIIKSKCEMLDNLLEIEVAYSLLKEGTCSGTQDVDPIDSHYKKLKTDLEVVSKEGNEFKMIREYVEQTHAATHNMYSLEVQEVFKVNRHGESARFKPFSKLHNRMLLWHGSRVTNYAGILSQGLRIAPPEAPVTGYMFGKGVYFADMVSKSANYCATSSSNPIGLLMLCEVALGDMYERTHSEYVQKLPKGKHSTKGVGRTMPDPTSYITDSSGVVVPKGRGISATVKNSSLLYNEYIIYDVAQVNIKYLLQTNFKWKF